jgi:putative FmdB family regulatory protein
MVNNDYKCHRCEYKWEQFTKRKARVKCPKCSSEKVRIVFSALTIHKNVISDASLRKENII